MGQQLGLGAAIGGVVALMCWRGNQTPHLVSVFPDGITLLLLIALLSAVVWFEQRRRKMASMRAGLTIAAATGVVFGSAVALLGTLRLTNPSVVLSSIGFLIALGSSLVCGAVATLAWSRKPGAADGVS